MDAALSKHGHLITRPGVAADVGHINTKSTVKGYNATASELKDAVTGAEIILIPAGVPRKPGMTRDGMITLFKFKSRSSDMVQTCSTPTPALSVT